MTKPYAHPVWIICLIALILHQASQKLWGQSIIFLDNYLDSFLAMPLLLGLLLMERRWLLKWGQHYTLSLFEVGVAVIFFSLLFELAFPYWFEDFTRDPIDCLAYALGAVIFMLTINRIRR